MCKALDDLYNDGMERGMERGIFRGMEQKTEQIIHNMFLRGVPVEDAAAIAEEDVERVRRLYEQWK